MPEAELTKKLAELQAENHNLRRRLGWAEAEVRRLRDAAETREWIEVQIKGE